MGCGASQANAAKTSQPLKVDQSKINKAVEDKNVSKLPNTAKSG